MVAELVQVFDERDVLNSAWVDGKTVRFVLETCSETEMSQGQQLVKACSLNALQPLSLLMRQLRVFDVCRSQHRLQPTGESILWALEGAIRWALVVVCVPRLRSVERLGSPK
jgi:hypothetical protein